MSPCHLVTLPTYHPFIVNGTTGAVGKTTLQVTVDENFGPRYVVRGRDGKEHVVWGKDLRRCNDPNDANPSTRQGPYESLQHNKWNRNKLRKVKAGSVVEHRVNPVVVPPTGCVAIKNKKDEWVKTKVLRVIRSGSSQKVLYSVPVGRCIHHESVKLTRRTLTRARRDNRLWGDGCRPHASFVERQIVSPEQYDHLREWVFSTDFLEPLKATEQATQRGHCFAIREAATTTFERYKVLTLTLTLTLFVSECAGAFSMCMPTRDTAACTLGTRMRTP